MESNFCELLEIYDILILDGSFLYFNDIAENIKQSIFYKNINANLYVFKSSIEIWDSLGNTDTLQNNIKALNRMRNSQFSNKLYIRESEFENNIFNLNKNLCKAAIVTQNKFEAFLLSKTYKNIEFLYYDGIYFKIVNNNMLFNRSNVQIWENEIEKPHIFKKYYTDCGRVWLIRKIGSGKEGTVYRLQNFNCAKIYYTDGKNNISDLMIKKLNEMVMCKSENNIVLPKSLIYSDKEKRDIIGYTMKYIKGVPLSQIAKERHFSLKTKHKIVISMIKTISYIHSLGMMVGDYNLQNFIYRNGKVYFIDTDNYYCSRYSYNAIADFIYSKKYNYLNNFNDMVFCEFESLVLMIHYFYTNDEAYLHATTVNSKTELKTITSNNYMKEKGLNDELIKVLSELLRRSNRYTLLEIYQKMKKLL